MKANHIPRKERLENRIQKLEYKVGERVPIGKPNPYWMCKYCEQSEPAISYAGHYKGCPEPGWIKEIAYYKSLLAEELEKENSEK